MIEFILNSSHILTIFFTMIISILITFLSYQYSSIANTKKLAITFASTNLITENNKIYENLKIEFNGEVIKSLTSSTIKITNIGNRVITLDDFITSSPLIIKSTQKFLLIDETNCNISTTNSLNVVSLIKINDYCLQINFDFLDPRDEISLTLLHIGEISIEGCIKNGIIKT